jgi:hypothetical protein
MSTLFREPKKHGNLLSQDNAVEVEKHLYFHLSARDCY